MVVAIVGRSHSDKYKVARDLCYHSKGKFARLKSYTNVRSNLGSHYYMSPEDLAKVADEDIIYRTQNDKGREFVFLKHQFSANRFLTYVVDDPACLVRLKKLRIPYAVAFVDSPEGVVLARAEEDGDNIPHVESRLAALRESILDFDESGEYSLYLDTAKLSPTSRTLAVSVFYTQVEKWLKMRQEFEYCMPTLAEMQGVAVLRSAKALGFGISYV